jgi:exopolysaccharide production protein ExoY
MQDGVSAGASTTDGATSMRHSTDLTLTTEQQLIRSIGDELILDLRGERAELSLRGRSVVLDTAPPSLTNRVVVRAFDVVGATIGIVLLLPIWLGVAMAVRLTSSGPIFFRSPRVGQDGRPFEAYKFRSMVEDADRQLNLLLASDAAARAEYERNHKLKEDPRLTPIGGWIRKMSLDEIPQLVNVLWGEMSLVGPRPKLMSERERFAETLPTVLRVKPGMTGLWQVNGRSELEFDERIFLDVDYAVNRSIGRDLKICAMTVVQALRPSKHGAY